MKAKENPFKPTAGGEPPLLIGRGKVIRDFEKGLDNGVGAPITPEILRKLVEGLR